MKKKFTFGVLLYATLTYAQVGIGNNVTNFDDPEILKIVSSNKGVLLQNSSIPILSMAAPIVNPANSLLVYNTNTTTGKGFYFWLNNKWNPMLDTTNIYKYLGIVHTVNAVSTSDVNNSSPIAGVSYTMGKHLQLTSST